MTDVGQVCAIVARQLGRERVAPDARLIEDLQLESLDVVNVAAALETAYGLEIPDARLYEIDVVGDFARAIDDLRAEGAP